jgi:hypothetical protein
MMYDPNFRKEEPRYFPQDSPDRRIEWSQQNPGYDLDEPRSAACQLGINLSFFKHSVRRDPKTTVITGRGLIACNIPALRECWDGKSHHR